MFGKKNRNSVKRFLGALSAAVCLSVSMGFGHPRPILVGGGAPRNLVATGGHLARYVDLENNVSVGDLDRLGFEKVPETGYVMNTETGHPVWYKAVLANRGAAKGLLVEFPDHRIDFLDIYFLANGKVASKYCVGDHRPFDNRPIRHKNFVFPLDGFDDTLTVFYRVVSSQPVGASFYVRSVDFFVGYSNAEFMLLGGFYGSILLVFVLCMSVSLKTRDKATFFYSVYALLFGLFSSCQDGMLFMYVWPRRVPMYDYMFEVAIFLAAVSHFCYAYHFLNLRGTSSFLKNLSLVFLWLRVVVFLLFLATKDGRLSHILFDSLVLLPLYFIGINAYMQGFKPARFFVLGNTSFYLGMFVHGLESMDLLSRTSVFTVYAAQIGIAFELVAQMFAFADKLNFEKTQKIKAQASLIESMRENERLNQGLIKELREKDELKDRVNKELERLVGERTASLQEAMSRIKEQSLRIESMNAELDKALYQTKRKVSRAKTEKLFNIVDEGDFDEVFATETECYNLLKEVKWSPFVCPRCGSGNYCNGPKPLTRRCSACNYVDSLTSNTIFHGCRIPIRKAFRIVAHLAQNNPRTLESLADELDLRKATVYDFAGRIRQKLGDKGAACSLNELILAKKKQT